MSFFDFFKTDSNKDKSIIPLQNQADVPSWFKWDIKNGILTVYGNGPLPDYEKDEVRPWDSHLELIKEVVIGTGITSSGTYTFTRMPNLKKITFEKDCVLIRLCVDEMPKNVEVKAKNVLFYYCRFVNYDSKNYPSATTRHIKYKMMETYSYVINNFFKDYPDLVKRYLKAAQKEIYGWYDIVEIIYRHLSERVYMDAEYDPELFWNSKSLELFCDKCTNYPLPNVTVVGNDLCVYYAGENQETNGHMHHEDILILGVIIAKHNVLNKNGKVLTNIRPWPALLESFYTEVYNHRLILDYDIPTGNKELDEERKNHPSIILVNGAPREFARLDYINGEYKLFVSMADDRFHAGSCHVLIGHLIKDNRVYVKDLWDILKTRFKFSGYYPIELPMEEYIEI